jgi:hypothetical protein
VKLVTSCGIGYQLRQVQLVLPTTSNVCTGDTIEQSCVLCMCSSIAMLALHAYDPRPSKRVLYALLSIVRSVATDRANRALLSLLVLCNTTKLVQSLSIHLPSCLLCVYAPLSKYIECNVVHMCVYICMLCHLITSINNSKKGVLDQAALTSLSKLIFFVFQPCLLFVNVASTLAMKGQVIIPSHISHIYIYIYSLSELRTQNM